MAKLVYVDDDLPGISRKRSGTGWSYYDPDGKLIEDDDERERLNALAVPPAYKDVWLCPSPDGHIQATGYDDKGRKQYRYNEKFREQQDAAKYGKLVDFGEKLSLIRARIASDMDTASLDKTSVVAAVVRLLDLGRVRIGNRTYARSSGNFGATTLRDRHVKFGKGKLVLDYKGKSGKDRHVEIEDGNLAKMVRKCRDIPGQQLFQFVDEDGDRHPVGSSDINAYIHEAMGADFTAKHFRTWGASALAFQILAEAGKESLSLKQLLDPVAEMLGNTAAMSRKAYVHPALIEIARDGAPDYFGGLQLPRKTKYLSRHERGLIGFLESV